MSLALLVLCSTFSFTVEKHYCGPFLVDIAVFESIKDCGMNMLTSTETNTEQETMSCCKHEVELLQSQDELNVLSFDDLNFNQQLFIIAYANAYINSLEGIEHKKTSFSEYPPPLIIKQIFKLDEAYII